MNDKRTQKNIRRRRGAGIEMAMILMLVVVAFSALLTSTVLMQTQKVKRSTEQLEQLNRRVVLDQIGRDFCEQRGNYVLPTGVTGTITPTGCHGCCIGCEECDAKYKSSETKGSNENNGDTGGTGETTGVVDDRAESDCCETCENCTTGCTEYTGISLVASYGGETLIVVMEKNQDGSFTVTKWSYGG